jgi:hypothetical protein
MPLKPWVRHTAVVAVVAVPLFLFVLGAVA